MLNCIKMYEGVHFPLWNIAPWVLSTATPLFVAPGSPGAFCGAGALGLCFLQSGRSGVLGTLCQGEERELARGRAGFSAQRERAPHCWCFAALWWQHAVALLSPGPPPPLPLSGEDRFICSVNSNRKQHLFSTNCAPGA